MNEMAKTLEDITIEIPSSVHRDGILHLVKNVMLEHEPVMKAKRLTWEVAHEGWGQNVDVCLAENGHSNIAIYKNNEIVGLRLGHILETSTLDPNFGFYDSIAGASEGSRLFASFVNGLTSDWRNVLVQNGQTCEKILHLMTLCVRPDFGQRGLALAMTQENLSTAKAKGCGYATVVATNWMSQRVFEKLNFRVAGVRLYSEFCDKSGEPMLDIKDPKNPCMKWMVKEL